MKIILDTNWYIEDDGAGYTLIKLSGKEVQHVQKDGTVRITQQLDHQSYPPTITACIEKYIRMAMVEKHQAIQLGEYVKEFKKAYEQVAEQIKGAHITR